MTTSLMVAEETLRRAEAIKAEARRHKQAARHHRRMAAEKMAEFERFCAEVGIDLDLGTAEGGTANVNQPRSTGT